MLLALQDLARGRKLSDANKRQQLQKMAVLAKEDGACLRISFMKP